MYQSGGTSYPSMSYEMSVYLWLSSTGREVVFIMAGRNCVPSSYSSHMAPYMIRAPNLRALYICLHRNRPPSRGAAFRGHCPLDMLKPLVSLSAFFPLRRRGHTEEPGCTTGT